jgi:uncharacterized protein (UPF0335 family)
MSKEMPKELAKRMERLEQGLGDLGGELTDLRSAHDAATGKLNDLIDKMDKLRREWRDVLAQMSEWLADTQPEI